MRQTKKITLSAACIALGVVFMALGYFVEVLDLTVSALISCIMAFVFIEIGDKYAFGVWLATSLLGAVFFTASLVWVTYFLVFGIYPILKAYIERLKRPLWTPIKLAVFLVSALLVLLVSEFILGIPFFSDDMSIPIFSGNTTVLKVAIFVALIGAMYLYDIFMTAMIRFYFASFRRRIQTLLK